MPFCNLLWPGIWDRSASRSWSLPVVFCDELRSPPTSTETEAGICSVPSAQEQLGHVCHSESLSRWRPIYNLRNHSNPEQSSRNGAMNHYLYPGWLIAIGHIYFVVCHINPKQAAPRNMGFLCDSHEIITQREVKFSACAGQSTVRVPPCSSTVLLNICSFPWVPESRAASRCLSSPSWGPFLVGSPLQDAAISESCRPALQASVAVCLAVSVFRVDLLGRNITEVMCVCSVHHPPFTHPPPPYTF